MRVALYGALASIAVTSLAAPTRAPGAFWYAKTLFLGLWEAELRDIAGRYRVQRRLGRGGMGAVYRATDTALERPVAVKVIREDLVASAEIADRFRGEALAAARFSHPNVVTVHDFGITAGRAYLVMEPTGWYVLVPLAIASLLTGIVQSLGTTWGLFRHYWVLFKLLMNVFATVVLLTYMETFRFMARVAADPNADLGAVRNASPMLHAVLALVLLLVATVLAVYRPRGVTRYGWRKQHEQRSVLAT